MSNLIPLSKRTKEEQREIQRAGGRKSGEVRRRRADMRHIVEEFLSMPADGKPLANMEELDSLPAAEAAGLTVLEKITLIAIKEAISEKSAPTARARAREWLMQAGGYATAPAREEATAPDESKAIRDFMDALPVWVLEQLADGVEMKDVNWNKPEAGGPLPMDREATGGPAAREKRSSPAMTNCSAS